MARWLGIGSPRKQRKQILKERREIMRRVLSWLVLLILTVVFYICEYWLWVLVQGIYLFLYKLSPILFWVVVLGGGLTLVWMLIAVISTVIPMIIQWTQSVYHTHSGLRYKIVGIMVALFFALNAVLTVVFVMRDKPISRPLVMLLACLTMVGYGIYLVASSSRIADEDGPPLTKRERLQAKLDKLDEKERNQQ